MSSAATIRMCYCGVAHAEGIPCDQVPKPTALTFSPEGVKYHYHVPFSDRLSVWLKNIPNWPTALAVWYLSRRLQRDKPFRDSWHANIAMPIYDALQAEGVWHQPAIKQANKCADRLLHNLFGA